MLYQITKAIAIYAVKTFFNRVIVKNRRYIPKSGPIIFAANHPNSMMDPLLVGYACKHRLHFLAKSTLFSRRLNKWFLSHLGLIPVYRRQDNPDEVQKNEEMFQACYDLLADKKCILIFPEGISIAERVLHKIKTGAARIGLGAEERHDFNLNSTIIPVGINYSDVVRFRSDVYVRFGKPISVNDYETLYRKDTYEAVNQLTRQIETALSKLTTTVKELDLETIVARLETIYKKELLVDLKMETKDKHADFSVTKGLINAVEWYYEHDRPRMEEFITLLNRYINNLERLHLRDEFLSPAKQDITLWKRVKAFLFLALGTPIFLLGLINNYIPYKIPRWYTEKFVDSKASWAPMKLVIGIAAFIPYYTLLLFLIAQIVPNGWWVLGYALTLIPSGNFVLKYVHKAKAYRQHLRFMAIFYHKRILIYRIIEQRMELIQFLNQAKRDYMEAVGLSATGKTAG